MRHARLLPFMIIATGALACSSSSGADTSGNDAGPGKDAHAATRSETGADASHPEQDGASPKGDAHQSAGEAGADADAPPVPPVPVGTTLEKGAVTLLGITDDGMVIYGTSTTVKAIPVAGGAATTLVDEGNVGSAAPAPVAMVIHDNVFIWSAIDAADASGNLTFWNASENGGQPVQLSMISIPLQAASTADSTSFVYAEDPLGNGAVTSFFGASASAPTTTTPLAANLGGCGASAALSGQGSSAYAVVSGCVGNDPFATVFAYPVSTWASTQLDTSVLAFAVDATGTVAATEDTNGQLNIAPLAGTTPLAIISGTDFYLSPSDALVLSLETGAGTIFTSPVTSAAATSLVDMGAMALDAVSPDDKWLLFDSNANVESVTTLSLISTTPAAMDLPATSLPGGTNSAGVFGSGFTADSKYAVYLVGGATLMAASTSAPGAATTIAKHSGTTLGAPLTARSFTASGFSNQLLASTMVIVPGEVRLGSAADIALTGSKIAFVDAFSPSRGHLGQADLAVIDLSTTAGATTVMKAADPFFAVTSDSAHIVYTISFGGPTDGIYSVAVP